MPHCGCRSPGTLNVQRSPARSVLFARFPPSLLASFVNRRPFPPLQRSDTICAISRRGVHLGFSRRALSRDGNAFSRRPCTDNLLVGRYARMAEENTPGQAKAEHLEKLGPKLGPVYHALWEDFAWLRVKWAEYRQLFGTSPERIDLLNSAAGFFFRILQDTLWEDTLLHLARLTDSPDVGGKRNLTIRALPELCDDPFLRTTVSRFVDEALNAAAFARDWRNRHIGHCDLALALDTNSKPLSPASRAAVSSALTALHRVFNAISECLLGSTLADHVITPATGAEALLYVIRDGLEAEHKRRSRIESGEFTHEDIRHRPI